MLEVTQTASVDVPGLPIAIGGRLFRRKRGRVETYWRMPTVQIRDEDALVMAISAVARPIF